jgi:calcineurin-like phosphoesterase family protein
MNIYFTSDTHYHHKNIVRGTSDWEDKSRCRDFDTLEEHNKVIVDNINAVVKENDILYHLGDWSFGGKEQIYNFRKQLNCKTIHLILGNHDQYIKISDFWKGIGDAKMFSSVNDKLQVKYANKLFILNHFAERVWDKSHKGSIMLHGHSHGTLDKLQPEFTSPTWIGDNYFIKNYKTMDVGIDTHSEFRPYHLGEILDIMDKKEILLNVDHHNKNTN